jgi:ppGpp synthetase/RelA/SpoT-type nucleotidyltranferase
LVCKFIDAPKILAEALTNHAVSAGCTGRHIHRSTDEGYYAFHHYTAFQVEVVDDEWNSQTTNMEFEIQLTTQLQEVLRELTHPLYETAKLAIGPRDDQWKWDYDTPRFQTSYLGHTLHMIEAMIVQVRNTGKAPTSEPQQTTPGQAAVESSNPALNIGAEVMVNPAVPVAAPTRTAEEETNVPTDPENQQ